MRARLLLAASAENVEIVGAGFFVLGLALYVEIAYTPPMWVHLVLWLPLALVTCLGLLRPMKGLAVALQYAHKAEEGRLKK